MKEEKTDKKIISYYKKQRYITRATKDTTLAASSKAVNRIDLKTARWGQDGWILDYLAEYIFKGLMRDFHLELKEDGAEIKENPGTLFHFYIKGVEGGLLSAPMTSIDLKQAKEFTQKFITEKQLLKTIQKVGNKIFKSGTTFPGIENLDTKEIFSYRMLNDEAIFSSLMEERKVKGLKTVEHYKYYIMLTYLGIYLILTASAFYNVEFLPKALYRLNDSCNDFYRSIVGWWKRGHIKISYNKVRDRMGIRQETNPSVERLYVERNLDHLKSNKIIEDWKRINKGNRKYIKNEDVIYDITLSLKNRKRNRNYAIRKWREKMALNQAEVQQKEEENENKS